MAIVEKEEKPFGVAVLGLGNVGSEVVRIIEDSADDLAARIGAPLVLRGVGVRRVAADRGVSVDLLTEDIDGLVSRDDVDIVVEVMGPVEPARKAILAALEGGKSVVTANKALLAQSTGELARAAEQAHVDLYFEAAVAGAIPVIRPLTQSLAGDTVLRVAGIVNGTTNYILSAMNDTGASYDSALADASALGYAEADPTADVEGFDAAAKADELALAREKMEKELELKGMQLGVDVEKSRTDLAANQMAEGTRIGAQIARDKARDRLDQRKLDKPTPPKPSKP